MKGLITHERHALSWNWTGMLLKSRIPVSRSSTFNNRISGFDGIRGIAATAVILYHTALRDTYFGAIGVSIFFVLSGYLIIGILSRSRLAVESGEISIRSALCQFWRRRVLRLCPVYYTALGATIALDLWIYKGDLLRESFWYVTYLQNFYIAFTGWGQFAFTHTWTLAIEQQFYLLASLGLLLTPARLHVRLIAAAFAGSLIFDLSFRSLGFMPIVVNLLPPNSFIFLAAGGLLVLSDEKIPAGLAGRMSIITAGIITAGLIAEPYTAWVGSDEGQLLLTVIACSLVIIYVARNPSSILTSILELSFLRWLGTISYSLYIVHIPVRNVIRSLATVLGYDPSSPVGRLLFFLVVFMLSAAIATISWFSFERYLTVKAKPRTRLIIADHHARAPP